MILLDERNYLRPQLEIKGFDVFDFFENPEVLDIKAFNALELKRRGEVLLVDTQTILNHPEEQENLKTILNTFLGAVFFHDHSNAKAQEWVTNEGGFLTKIIGEYSLPMPQLNWTMLSNQLQFFHNLIQDQKTLQKHMTKFSVELDQVLQNAEVEMIKAKKVHDTLIPRRAEEIKGISFSSKYAAGSGGGGEFYDLFQGTSKVYQVLISGQSYLISSALMGILSQHREKKFEVESFLKAAYAEIMTINGAKKKKSFVDLLVLELDLVSLTLKAHTDSKSELYSQAKGVVSISKDSSWPLQKGEKLIVFSPGFLFNWNEGHPDKHISDFLKVNINLPPAEMISELFFQLSENKDGQFLNFDATLVSMEVNRHGIHKV